MNDNQVTIETECKDCGATGVYHGYAEPEGVGVICYKCDGTGKIDLTYIPFTGRKKRSDIRNVIRHSPNEVTYEEFLRGRMPS